MKRSEVLIPVLVQTALWPDLMGKTLKFPEKSLVERKRMLELKIFYLFLWKKSSQNLLSILSCNVFVASSSLSTSLDVKNTQDEKSGLGDINVDTKDMVSYVDGTKKVVNVDLTTCDVEISHLDTILYYMRKKAKYEPNIVVNFYLEKGIDKFENETLLIKMIDELPQQTQCDCGAFVCAFAEYVIHGRDIPKEIDIGYVRMRYGALLWDYEKRKLQVGIKDNTTEKVGGLFGKEKRKKMHQEE
ncbi:hypothetical protein CQW23_23636 [Capsicum baccatum]|uniref:Ubiquitin-like protease family profile domain-containing protein n=1 Tax=Capsicum baccatum TaxID=33114 RepID=A0A2G2VSJ5_CAPBA|nr:hypothetical protein CQW23_23636 [Capsicum baccatum]